MTAIQANIDAAITMVSYLQAVKGDLKSQWGRGEWGVPWKSFGDARHLAQGYNCRLWSHLGCLGQKVTIILFIQVSLRGCIKKFTKYAVISALVCLLNGSSFSHTHIGLP